MNPSTWDTLRRIAADIFSQPADSVTADASPETIETWDSVQHVSLVLAIEEHFGIQIEPEEFEKMNSLGKIAELLDGKLAG